MRVRHPDRHGFAWLELLLALAVLALLFQVFPSLQSRFLSVLDARNWTRGVWMSLNVAVVPILFGIRFGPELYAGWRRRRRPRVLLNSEREKKQLSIKEERALYERMHEARKKQVV